jgi:hypothetical protein
MNELNELKSIAFSLLKRETDVKDGKAEYTKKKTVRFVIPKSFFENVNEEETTKKLISSMFSDLRNDAPDDVDSLGLFLEYETTAIDNAISLRTLESILEYSKERIDPVYEFFKMTQKNNG